MDDVLVKLEDYIGRYVRVTSKNDKVVDGVLYHTKDYESFKCIKLLDCTYILAYDFFIYSFNKEDVKDIEVLI